jgi:hypothetical protein
LRREFISWRQPLLAFVQRQFLDPQRDFSTNRQDTLTFNADVVTAHKYTNQSSAKTVVDTITALIRALIPLFKQPSAVDQMWQFGDPKHGADKNLVSTKMSRPRHRVCLQDGLKLDLNQLARQGFIKFGSNIGARRISWSNSLIGEKLRAASLAQT